MQIFEEYFHVIDCGWYKFVFILESIQIHALATSFAQGDRFV